jgi:hypothetical protein
MVRPKTSNKNLTVALAFASIVIVSELMDNIHDALRVHRKGLWSLYAVFCACLPELARNMNEQNPKNTSFVSCIKFNKILHSSGLQSIHRQESCKHGVKWTLKVADACFN